MINNNKTSGVNDFCPSCKVPIIKDGGCWHMTCANCHIHFCWGCMHEYSGNGTDCSCGLEYGSDKTECRYVYHHMNTCSNPVHKRM